MEEKLQVTFRQTLLNPCHTRLHGLSNGYRASLVGETQEKRGNQLIYGVTAKNGGKRRKMAIF